MFLAKLTKILIAISLIVLTQLSYAEITMGNTSQQSSGGTTASFNHNLTTATNRVVVVGISIEAEGKVGRATNITYGGVTMHEVPNSFASIKPGNFSISTEFFYLDDGELPTSGNQNIQITYDGSDVSAGALQVNGVVQSSPQAATSAANSPSNTSTSINTSSTNNLLIDIVGGGHPSDRGQFQVNASQSTYWGVSAPSSQGAGSTQQVGAAGSYTLQWAASGMNRVAHSVLAFAPVSNGTSGNQTPVLNAIGNQSVQEGATKVVTLTATDADNDSLSFSSIGLPSYANLTDNNNNTATLRLTPQVGDAGSSDITIRVTDNVNSAIEQTLTLTVTTDGGSSSGSITLGSSSQQSTSASSMSFNHSLSTNINRMVVVGVSIEAEGHIGRATSITYGGVAMHAIPNSLASIQPGNFSISSELFYLTDAELPASGSNSIQVSHDGSDISAGALQLNGVNQSNPDAVATQAINSPSSISASITTLTVNTLLLDVIAGGHPTNQAQLQVGASQTRYWGTAARSSQGGGSTRQLGVAGSYTQQWSTSGMNRAALSVVAFTPASGNTTGNQAPILSGVSDQAVQEGESKTVAITALDADGDSLSFSSSNLPDYATFTDNGNNTATLNLSPEEGDAGNTEITIRVTDGTNAPVQQTLNVIVTTNGGSSSGSITLGASSQKTSGSGSVNFSHQLTVESNRAVVVGVSIEAEGKVGKATSITYGGVAMHAVPNSLASKETGSFSISTQLFILLNSELPSSGSQNIIVAHDGSDISASALQINGVIQGNPHAVATHGIGSPASISTSITTLSPNALLVDIIGGGHPADRAQVQANANQTSYWGASAPSSQGAGSTRQVGAAGSYSQQWSINGMNRTAHTVIAFAPASGGGTPTNQPPVLNTIGNQTLQEGESKVATITVTDTDMVSITSLSLPGYVTLTDNGNNTATLRIAPQTGEAGIADITIRVTDNVNAPVEETLRITVTSSNNGGGGSGSPANASRSTIKPSSTFINQNTTSNVAITVQLKDDNGSNLSTGGASVTLTTISGTLSGVTDNGNGTYSASLTNLIDNVTAVTVNGEVDNEAIGVRARIGIKISNPNSSALAQLGKKIFRDSSLSTGASRTSCGGCHDVSSGIFSDTRSNNTTSQGAEGLFGGRNTPTAAYAAHTPNQFFHNGKKIGGQFWDGRAESLEEQSMQPLMDPREMGTGNPAVDQASVISKIKSGSYVNDFKAVFGNNSLDNVGTAFIQVSKALAAFERTSAFSPFTSKWDAVQAGTAQFTSSEARGFQAFKDGGCDNCHFTPENLLGAQVFTNFEYENKGVPINSSNPLLQEDANFRDFGSGSAPSNPQNGPHSVMPPGNDKGKFKVPTLRNIAVTGPYMHNGVFDTLEQVINFHNGDPTGVITQTEVPDTVTDVSTQFQAQQKADLKDFLETLTDSGI